MTAVEMPHSIDMDRLSSFLDIDAPDLQSVLDSASDGVVFLLKQVQDKATEFEILSNEKELLEVNYGTLWDMEAGLICRTRGSYHECQGDEYAGPTPKSIERDP
jgi:hypothetical protein